MFTHFERSVRLKECVSENTVYHVLKWIFLLSIRWRLTKKEEKKIYLRIFVNIFITFQEKNQLN